MVTGRHARPGLRFPLVLRGDSWGVAVREFYRLLGARLGEGLVEVLAAPEEDSLVYDSNVVVVARGDSVELREVVAGVEGEVERKYGVSISPMIVAPEWKSNLARELLEWKSMSN